MTNRAPLIVAIVLLLLPVLYVGSYLALVLKPSMHKRETFLSDLFPGHFRYRFGGRIATKVFWPLEQIDRKVRPEAWE
ncbi:hypothetical protein NA78x_001576 [Anatilimnocola sp. NA78]|uniref:hypothetical protein n=1 Tax=Anatilimnocola sp. NA78 TaxID=3415683 RepID=UPI003CE4AB74